MKFTGAQMEQFRDAAASQHRSRILRFVRERYPHSLANVPADEALDRIEWGLRWIRRAGVTDSHAAAMFVVAQFAVGPTFYTHPRCGALFADRRLPPDARVMSMFHASAGIPWDEIAAGRDDAAWSSFRDEAVS